MLVKRLPALYSNWKCSFCNNVDESLAHLLDCPHLVEQWKHIQVLLVEVIKDYLNKHQISTTVVPSIENVFPPLPTLCNEPPVVKQLAKGVVPVYFINDLKNLGINTHTSSIASACVVYAMFGFKRNI